MNFIVNGYDHTDEHALERRMKVRDAHMAGIKEMFEYKKVLYAAAMLNEAGYMCGSTLIVDFENREELDEWLEVEPYVKDRVWERVEVIPCKVPPMFL